MLVAYKYRLYPNKDQKEFLDRNFGCVRFVWNAMTAAFNSWSAMGPNRTVTEKTLKDDPENAFLGSVISYALQQKRIDFDVAKSQYFNPKRKKKLGRMKFKAKGRCKDSFRIPFANLVDNAIDLENNKLKLPKMSPMKMVVDRPFSGNPRNVTISKNKAGQYFVSVLVEEDRAKLPKAANFAIGIDVGLKDIATLSNGLEFKNPRYFRETQSKLAKAQRHLSRKYKGSARYAAQKLKVAKLHLKVANQRAWHLHQLSNYIIKSYNTIIMETLNVQGMARGTLGKSVSDASISELICQISYKSLMYGRTFHQIDRWFASSKTCSNCNHKLDALDRGADEWSCPACGTHHDRDINAAINILNKGLDDLYDLETKSEEKPDYMHGEELRLLKENVASSLHPRVASSMKCRDLHNLQM